MTFRLTHRFAMLLSALAIALASAGTAAANGGGVAAIKHAAGTVAIERAGETTPAEVGATLKEGDRVVTGADGSVGFTMRDGGRFSLGPDSAIVISQFKFEPSESVFAMVARLLYGAMVHATGEIGRLAPEAVRIETSLGNVGVRGTEFAVRAPRS